MPRQSADQLARMRRTSATNFRHVFDVWRAAYNAQTNTFGRKQRVLQAVPMSVYPGQRLDQLSPADIAGTTSVANAYSGNTALDSDIRKNDTLVPVDQAYTTTPTYDSQQYNVNAVADWPTVRVLSLTREGG